MLMQGKADPDRTVRMLAAGAGYFAALWRDGGRVAAPVVDRARQVPRRAKAAP